jgi:hypothetical protein
MNAIFFDINTSYPKPSEGKNSERFYFRRDKHSCGSAAENFKQNSHAIARSQCLQLPNYARKWATGNPHRIAWL